MKEKSLNIRYNQVEKLTELGFRLQQMRQQQSLSLEEVANRTQIQPRLLKAIEEGNIELLPEPVYIRGFIKRFADTLGMNGGEVASSFPIGGSIQFIRPTWQHISVGQLRPVHLYVIYIVLVIGAVNALSYVVNRSAIQASGVDKQYQQAASNQLTGLAQTTIQTSDGTGTYKTIAASKLSSTGQPVRVGITLNAPTWLKVVADGKTKFEGQLPKGAQLSWVASEQLTVQAGNAGGVLVAFNDKKAEQLGAPGKMLSKTFAATPKS